MAHNGQSIELPVLLSISVTLHERSTSVQFRTILVREATVLLKHVH